MTLSITAALIVAGVVGLWFYRQWLRRSLLLLFGAVFIWSMYLNVKGALWWT